MALLAAWPAQAQVTVNPGALDLLPKPPAQSTPTRRPTPPHTRPAAPPATTPATTTPAATPTRPRPANTPPTPPVPSGTVPPPAATTKPALPLIPPAVAALPPPAPVPPPRPQIIPLVPVAADAPGTASTEPGGLRVTFGTGRSDLNPATERAIRTFAAGVRAADTVTINIYAYASGTPDDASIARRLSLARALSARAVLINEGIASPRIYPKAMGSTGGDTDPDRVDVVAGAPGPPASIAPAVAANAPLPAPTKPAPR